MPSKHNEQQHQALRRSITLDLSVCPRCAGSHKQIEFRRFELGDRQFTHWGYCPATAEPLMVDLRDGSHKVSKFITEWVPAGTSARIREDKKFPNGKDVMPEPCNPFAVTCKLDLPYPAKGVGVWKVTCSECKQKAIVPAAGRRCDPRTVTLECKTHQTPPPEKS